jgi:hypothetical protein
LRSGSRRRPRILERAAILGSGIRRRSAAERLPLLFERDALNRRRPLPREELNVPVVARNYGRGAVGKLEAAPARRNRHLPADQARVTNLLA